jgi:uncharacterized repeat protein (TIGR01451 family)
VVILPGGRHRVGEPLKLTSEDSNVTYRSAEGQQAVIDAGMPVTGWQPATVNGDVTLRARGGTGGDGGTGGSGGDGGDGGERANAGTSGDGGDGGDAGFGGNAGSGGNGAPVGLSIDTEVTGSVIADASGGQAGAPGSAGAAGAGGSEGDTFNADPGQPGQAGNPGNGGATGTAGAGGNIGIDIASPVGGDITARSDASVTITLDQGASVGGSIDGDPDGITNDATLAFRMDATQSESDALDTQGPAGGSVTIGGDMFDWSNFDTLVNNTTIIDTDLVITKVAPGSATAGTTATFTLTVSNNGAIAADGVTIEETPGAGLTFDSASAPCGGGFPCNIGTLAAGDSLSVDATFTIAPDATGSVGNTASLDATTPLYNTGDDASTTSTMLGTTADLALAKTASTTTAKVGEEFDYTLEVVNNGPSTATNVVVTDNLPPGVEAVSTTGCQEDPAGVPACTVGSMAPGDTATINIRAEAVGTPGLTTNTASVSSDASDPTPDNNQGTVEVFAAIGVPALSTWALIAMSTLLVLLTALMVVRPASVRA